MFRKWFFAHSKIAGMPREIRRHAQPLLHRRINYGLGLLLIAAVPGFTSEIDRADLPRSIASRYGTLVRDDLEATLPQGTHGAKQHE